jgi:hypothetical protein
MPTYPIDVTATVTHPLAGYSVITLADPADGSYSLKALTNDSNWGAIGEKLVTIWGVIAPGQRNIPTDKPATIRIDEGWLYMLGWGVPVGTDTVVTGAAGSKLIIDTTAAESSCTPAYPRVLHPIHGTSEEPAAIWVRAVDAVMADIDPDYQRRRRTSDLGGQQNLLCGEDVVLRAITGICKSINFYPLPCEGGE